MAGDKVSAGLPNRGHTYHGGTPSGTIGRSIYLEGTEGYFDDEIVNTGMRPNTKRTGRQIEMMLVRNTSGIALLPKRTVSWQALFRGRRVDGYVTATNAEAAGVVDDQLPAAGVANNDLFWLHRKGPTLVLNDIASGQPTNITVDSSVGALTAVTSQSTTAGRVTAVTMNATTPGAGIINSLGRAMTARTTGNTDATLLVDLDIKA